MEQINFNKSKLVLILPLIGTALIVAWSYIISPYTAYGDNWAIYPVIAIALSILVWHFYLFITTHGKTEKLFMSLYGIVHILALCIVSIYCVMIISKDNF
jgi:hypothetical protein